MLSALQSPPTAADPKNSNNVDAIPHCQAVSAHATIEFLPHKWEFMIMILLYCYC